MLFHWCRALKLWVRYRPSRDEEREGVLGSMVSMSFRRQPHTVGTRSGGVSLSLIFHLPSLSTSLGGSACPCSVCSCVRADIRGFRCLYCAHVPSSLLRVVYVTQDFAHLCFFVQHQLRPALYLVHEFDFVVGGRVSYGKLVHRPA